MRGKSEESEEREASDEGGGREGHEIKGGRAMARTKGRDVGCGADLLEQGPEGDGGGGDEPRDARAAGGVKLEAELQLGRRERHRRADVGQQLDEPVTACDTL